MNTHVRPIKALRLFLQKHPDTEEFSSQLGLAQLVDRSESLVRAIEGGRMETSRKFAKELSSMTGVSKDWLLLPDVDSQEVPSERGVPLQHNEVVARIQHQIHSNLDDVAAVAQDARVRAESGETALSAGGNIQRQMAANMASLVEVALCESLTRGDTRLMEEITRLLTRQHAESE